MLLFEPLILFQAYMYGFFKNKRIVLYDTLIQQVSWNNIFSNNF
jgi:hypothetical protein